MSVYVWIGQKSLGMVDIKYGDGGVAENYVLRSLFYLDDILETMLLHR